MRGDLVEKTAADVCRDLAASEASGVLAIEGPDGPARVVFAAGRIIAAVSPAPRARLGDRLVGAGELDPDDLARALRSQDENGQNPRLGALLVEQGLVRPDAVRVFVQEQVLDALFEIIRWRYGAFAFTADDGSGSAGIPLSLTVDDALVEVARRQQEWQQLSRVIPDLEAIPNFRQGAATASASLEPDEFAVLASVDGERSIRALANDLGYGEFEAARIVYGLSLLGIVDVRLPQDAIGAALEDALALGPADRGEVPVDADDEVQDGDDGLRDADRPQPGDAADEDSWAQVHDISAAGEPDVWVSPPDDDAASDPAAPDGTHPAPDGDTAEPPPPPAASTDMPDFFATPPVRPSVVGDHSRRDESDDHGDETTLDITFDVPDPTPDRSPTGRDPSETSPAEAFAEIYADDDRGTRNRGTGSRSADNRGADGRTGPGADEVAGATDDATGPSQTPSVDEPGRRDEPASAPQRGDDNDVSEFLRELSRLSLDPPTKQGSGRPKPPKDDPPAPPREQDTGKKKRRGLFGRG